MAEPQEVTLGYIADAGLRVDAAMDLLNPDRPFEADEARKVLEELTGAVEDLVQWARQVNRAISGLPGIHVDDFPTD